MNIHIEDLLREIKVRDGSDLVLKANSRPLYRIYGDLLPVDTYPDVLAAEDVAELIHALLTHPQRTAFERDLELDFSYEIKGVSRFRVNVFQQQGSMGLVARAIPFEIRTLESIGAPEVLADLCEAPRGLVLVTGPTGCGKSSTLAGMIHYINQTRSEHIIAIEDPIEFVYTDKRSLINQRELGTDTHSFAEALRHVLRQDPDVILIGEMRDLETVALAITAAETGHLVFATLHTTDAVQTIDRIIDVFPTHQQQQIRVQLAVNLVGVVSQVLVKRPGGEGRVAAFEVLVATSAVRNLIREAKTYQLPSVIQTASNHGMVDLDQSLARLAAEGKADPDDARMKSANPSQFDQHVAYLEARATAGASGGVAGAPQPPTG
jgi:twitching motility protein PilT